MTTIKDLRNKNKLHDAMRGILAFCERKLDDRECDKAFNTIRNHFMGINCLLLDWAVQVSKQKKWAECIRTLDALEAKLCPLIANLADRQLTRGLTPEAARACYEVFRGRLGLIRACVTDNADSQKALQDAIKHQIDLVKKYWDYQPDDTVQTYDSSATQTQASEFRATFLRHLPNDGIRAIFRELAAAHGSIHPGLLMAGETIANLTGRQNRADHKVTTWIIFASETENTGIIARLTIERLPNGCGLLIPDPRSSGYHIMDCDFSNGFQHAYSASYKIDLNMHKYDYRWRIEIGQEEFFVCQRKIKNESPSEQCPRPLARRIGGSR